MNNDNEMRMKGKLNFFMDEKIKVHIKRKDGYFWNGLLIEKLRDDVFIIKEKKLGLCHLFISDVVDVVEFTEGGE